ncbi:MAG: DMT family transporter [Bosea sp.]|nr:DMT family transporter [Bosea sp. (in: a-proteobacteria)]
MFTVISCSGSSQPVTATPSNADLARSQRLKGIALMCAALAIFSVLDASAKWISQHMHPMQAVWARYAVSVLLVMVLINPWTRPGVMRSSAPVLQGIRSLMLLLSTVFNFLALQYLQLAEAIAIIFTTPLLIALLSGPLLGEWPGPRRMIAIGVGFVGVLVVTRPGHGGLHPAAILSVMGVVCYAFYNLSTRKLASHDSSETTMVYSGAAGVLLVTPAMAWLWTTPDSALVWGLMLLMGACGGFGHWLVIKAHRLAPASVLAPFIYTQLVWMLILGWQVFGQWPDAWTLGGGMIVVSSGLYLLYRERVRGVDAKPVA